MTIICEDSSGEDNSQDTESADGMANPLPQVSNSKGAIPKKKTKRRRCRGKKKKLPEQGEDALSSKTKGTFLDQNGWPIIKENPPVKKLQPSNSPGIGFNHILNQSQPKIDSKNVSILASAFHDLTLHIQKSNNFINNLSAMQTRPQISSASSSLERVGQAPNSNYEARHVYNFREMPVFPSHYELSSNASPFLQSNVTKGRFLNVEHYLSVHFRLMREDLIRPLRDDIEHCSTPNLKIAPSSHNYKSRIFHVQIGKTYYSEMGILTKVTFDIDPFSDVDWEISKLLTGGSLVCLSHNNFKSFTLATVAYSNPENLKKGKVTIKIENPNEEFQFYSLFKPHVMIEATSFFEAYRYVLEGIKSLSEECFPFKKYIVYAHNVSSPPSYLQNYPNCDFSCLLSSESGNSRMVNVLNPASWPKREELGLDMAQYDALQASITEEFAIIQGPPGTGKTFIGLKVVNLMLNSNFPKPILVVAFTNHALDQFLEGISCFTTQIARVGGGSNSEILESFQLKNLKEDLRKTVKLPKGIYKTLREYRDHLSSLKAQIKKLEEDVEKSLSTLISFEILKSSMQPKHRRYFRNDHDLVSWLNIDSNTRASAIHNGLKQKKLTYEEEDIIDNVMDLNLEKRWSLYATWHFRHISPKLFSLKNLKEEHIDIVENIKKFKGLKDIHILKKMDVIGITTTGATKYKSTIDQLDSRIVIIEEAAEVLEAHIVSSLPKSIQHLILIGDHQQLKPRTSVYQLAKDYKMDISLFERMVRNKIKCHRLVTQHRMRPDIAALLVPDIYPTLENAPSVYCHESIKGVTKNVFFVSHSKPEHQSMPNPSYANYYEAAFLFELCLYFRDQGYKASQMTILVTYANQKANFEKLIEDAQLPESFVENLRVTTVDGYQGEENDIILLSLVRSNEEENIGFLSITNRVCVALSRARKGLYCIGNFKILGRKCKLWKNILEKLQVKNCVGPKLPLCCPLHPTFEILVGELDDFSKSCEAPCALKLECGHLCAQKCHRFNDPDHLYYRCQKKCNKVVCQNYHRCPLKCYQSCEPCNVEVSKLLPGCGHIIQVPCSLDLSEAVCSFTYFKKAKCGHMVQVACSANSAFCLICKKEMLTLKNAEICHLT